MPGRPAEAAVRDIGDAAGRSLVRMVDRVVQAAGRVAKQAQRAAVMAQLGLVARAERRRRG